MKFDPADTRTERLEFIADTLADEGQYTRAASVYAIAHERDALLKRIAELEELQRHRHSMAITPANKIPVGWDTALGYLAKHCPELLGTLDTRTLCRRTSRTT